MTSGSTRLRNAARRLGYRVVRLRFNVRRALTGFRVSPAERLLIAPQELEPGDPSFAVAFYSGHIMLAGRSAQTRGQSPFEIAPPSHGWARQLHGFSWLRHFRDTDNVVIRHHARAIVGDWLKMRDLRSDPTAQLPPVAARRVLSWLSNATLLLSDAEHGYYHRFMRSLARDALWLEFCARRRTLEMGRLTCAIALASYTLCALTNENDWKRASALLAAALAELILPDGVPVSRNPEDALAAAIDLLQLRTAYHARGRTPPAGLQAAIDRLMGFLALMRHPDGALGLFNGMGATSLVLLGAVLAFDDSGQATPSVTSEGGYLRATRSDAVLIADTGAAPPASASEDAHASALSFEFSTEHDRLIVNCGSAPSGMDDMREALRETPAHSTVAVDGASSARFQTVQAQDGAVRRRMLGAPAAVQADRIAAEAGATLTLRHDGYRRAYGLAHVRTLALAADGACLEGDDLLEPVGTGKETPQVGALLRFHLHPRVNAILLPGATAVRLELANGAVWSFEAGGAPLRLEESIYFGGLASQRRTVQIVVPAAQPGTALHWKLARRARPGS